ncbi:hypothetical protein Slit_2014 [Sideroxydans lithotrophicus ES-1]|uniref:Uncharacterized protein n=1 Tax=Sideroxydans lithotrophicus (strain ES-1) TaxID=580332 RepID=D5CTT0_SIDLE|nr:hypothetical protein Slit_2014 [Sideroxydans lithotrophicus ES-1]
MSLGSSYEEQDMDELEFNIELSWLAALSFVIADICLSMPWS